MDWAEAGQDVQTTPRPHNDAGTQARWGQAGEQNRTDLRCNSKDVVIDWIPGVRKTE